MVCTDLFGKSKSYYMKLKTSSINALNFLGVRACQFFVLLIHFVMYFKEKSLYFMLWFTPSFYLFDERWAKDTRGTLKIPEGQSQYFENKTVQFYYNFVLKWYSVNVYEIKWWFGCFISHIPYISYYMWMLKFTSI